MPNWNALLRALAPNGDDKIIAMIADHADEQFARWDISTIRRQAAVIAHAFVETAGFTRLDENLNYSAKRLTEVWPGRFPSRDAAIPYDHSPRALANKVYNGRMGNRPLSDDGWNNRGKGLWQCTGADNCAALGKKLGVDGATASAWLIDPEHALECACALFYILGVKASADAGDVAAQTRRINGGTNGLAEREQVYRKALALLAADAHADRVAQVSAADAAPVETKTADDLRREGSRTIKGGDAIQTAIVGKLGSLAGAGGLLASAQSVSDQWGQVKALYSGNADVIAWILAHPRLVGVGALLALALYFAWRIWSSAAAVKAARVDDANSGVNIGR